MKNFVVLQTYTLLEWIVVHQRKILCVVSVTPSKLGVFWLPKVVGRLAELDLWRKGSREYGVNWSWYRKPKEVYCRPES
jgi:hypothetical protein